MKYQLDSFCVIMSLILMTTLFYKAVIFHREESSGFYDLKLVASIDIESTISASDGGFGSPLQEMIFLVYKKSAQMEWF